MAPRNAEIPEQVGAAAGAPPGTIFAYSSGPIICASDDVAAIKIETIEKGEPSSESQQQQQQQLQQHQQQQQQSQCPTPNGGSYGETIVISSEAEALQHHHQQQQQQHQQQQQQQHHQHQAAAAAAAAQAVHIATSSHGGTVRFVTEDGRFTTAGPETSGSNLYYDAPVVDGSVHANESKTYADLGNAYAPFPPSSSFTSNSYAATLQQGNTIYSVPGTGQFLAKSESSLNQLRQAGPTTFQTIAFNDGGNAIEALWTSPAPPEYQNVNFVSINQV